MVVVLVKHDVGGKDTHINMTPFFVYFQSDLKLRYIAFCHNNMYNYLSVFFPLPFTFTSLFFLKQESQNVPTSNMYMVQVNKPVKYNTHATYTLI